MSLRLAVLLLLAAGVCACGQKGALYLPEPGTGTVITRPGTETPESAPQPSTQDSPPAGTASPETETDENSGKREVRRE